MSVDGLSADMAAKAHVSALKRDYVIEPRLGESRILLSRLYGCCLLQPRLPCFQITGPLEASADPWSSWSR